MWLGAAWTPRKRRACHPTAPPPPPALPQRVPLIQPPLSFVFLMRSSGHDLLSTDSDQVRGL